MNAPGTISRCNQVGFRLGFGLAILAATIAALMPTPPPGTELIGDKGAHLIAYLVLALLADLGWPESPYLLRKALPLFCYGIAIELLQHLMPPRSLSLYDIIANAGGLALYLPLLVWRRRLFPAGEGRCGTT